MTPGGDLGRPRTPRSPRTAARARAVRRRRAVALAAIVALGAVVAVIIVAASGGGKNPVPAALGGSRTPTLLSQGAPGAGPAHAAPPFKPAPAALAAAGRLSLAAQVAQVFLVGVEGTSTSSPGVSAFASEDWGGAVLGHSDFVSDAQLGTLAHGITTLSKNAGNLAPLIAAPQEGGPGTAFPDLPPVGEADIGASGNAATARAQARSAGQKLLALGVDMTFAPLADVDVEGGALTGRLFSTSAQAVAHFSQAAVGGYDAAGIISATGHFPGAGAASADPDQMSASVGGSLQSLEANDLIPFAAVSAGAPVIMMSNASYAAFDGVTPASLDPAAVRLLRERYRYSGVVMTDDLDAALQATGGTAGQAAVSALQAGDDLLYITGSQAEQLDAYHAALSAVQSGKISRDRLRNALLRVLTLKAHHGLL